MSRLRWFGRPWAVLTWVSVPVLIGGLVVVPGAGEAIRPWLWCLAGLVLVFLAARTKTVSWRFAALVFTAGVPLAVLAGLTKVLLAPLIGFDAAAMDGAVLISAPLAETLKLLPVLAPLAFARRLIRGLSRADFLIIGYAAGAGFQAGEDAIRRLAAVGRGDALPRLEPDGGYPQYGLEWLTGWSASHIGLFAGHAVATGLVAAGIGIAVRGRRPMTWPLPVALYGLVVIDHAMYAAGLHDPSGPHAVDPPGWLDGLWASLGSGGLERPSLTLILFVALIADARVVRLARPLLPPLPELPAQQALERAAARADAAIRGIFPADAAPVFHRLAGAMAATFAGPLQVLALVVDDLAVMVGAARRTAASPDPVPSGERPSAPPARAGRMPYGGRPGGGDGDRGPRWLAAMCYLRTRRRLAFEAERPGRRRRGGPVSATIVILVLAGVAAVALLGTLPAHELAAWWAGLPAAERGTAAAALAALLILGSLGFGRPGDGPRENVSFLRDPARAIWFFLTGLTPHRLAGRAAEHALGRVLPADRGAGFGAEARRRIADAETDPEGWLRRRREVIDDFWSAS